MKINFLLTINKKYIKPCAVTIVSVMENLNKKCQATFYIFCYDFKDKPDCFAKLEKKYNCTINCICTSQYDYYFSNQDVSKSIASYINTYATYHRILGFKILPDDVDKIIYIDTDMIVKTDLSLIYDFKDNDLFKAVVEPVNLIPLINKFFKKDFEEFSNWKKDRIKYAYFGAGIYVANLNRIKKEHIFEQIIDFIKKYPNIPLGDQDAINAIIGQKYSDYIEYLPPSYNFWSQDYSYFFAIFHKIFYKKKEIINAVHHPKVIHYIGKHKPWNNRNAKFYFNEWWKYYDLFPVDIKKPKLNPLNILIKLGNVVLESLIRVLYYFSRIFTFWDK